MADRAKRKGRRTRRRLVTAALLAPVLIAPALFGSVSASDDTGGTESTAAATGTDAAPTAGGDLVVVIPTEPRSLHRDVDNNRSSVGIARTVVEQLVEVEADSYAPSTNGLVTGWEQVDDLTWRFTVRDGVTFHNGEPFDAEVAAFNVERARDDATGASAPYFQLIDTATASDPTTFDVTTTAPAPYLPSLLMIVDAFPPAAYGDVEIEEFGRAPIGTGPFVFEEWVEGQHIRVNRFDDYYREPALVDSVTFTFASEETTRTALLQTGDAHITNRLSPQVITELEGQEGIEVHAVPALMKILLFFNLHEPPFDDVRVREAVARAVDPQLIVDTVFEGVGAQADPNLFHPMFSSAGGHDGEYITYDPERAAALLEEVGDIGPIDFHWPVGRYVLDGQVGEAVSGMLEAAGFEVNRDPLEAGAFFDLLLTNEMSGMHLLGSVPTFAHEDGPVASYFTTNSVITYCADGSIDELAAEGLSLPAGEERDAVYNELERILITEVICPVPLHIQVDGFATTDQVEGFVGDFDESWHGLRTVSLSDG
jgi:peptide/nickel transport system substrate-binding protein